MHDMLCCVYILTNKSHTVLYTGVTSNLCKRIHEHKTKAVPGFTSRYNVDKLVYYETTDNIESAIQREKQLKSWKRQWKVELIDKFNPEWKDLYESFL